MARVGFLRVQRDPTPKISDKFRLVKNQAKSGKNAKNSNFYMGKIAKMDIPAKQGLKSQHNILFFLVAVTKRCDV